MEETTTEIPATKEVLKGKIVLVVDDESDLSSLIARAFSKKGAVVETAKDGEEALQRIEGKKPDLVVTDNSMPNMGGPELIRRLRENPLTENIPVILVSGDLFAGLNPEQIQKEALSLQANAGMSKPFSSIFAPTEVAERLLSQDLSLQG